MPFGYAGLFLCSATYFLLKGSVACAPDVSEPFSTRHRKHIDSGSCVVGCALIEEGLQLAIKRPRRDAGPRIDLAQACGTPWRLLGYVRGPTQQENTMVRWMLRIGMKAARREITRHRSHESIIHTAASSGTRAIDGNFPVCAGRTLQGIDTASDDVGKTPTSDFK